VHFRIGGSGWCSCRRWRFVLASPRKEGAEQLIVEAQKIISNKLKGRLEFRGSDEQEFVDLAQTLLNVHF